MSVPVYLFSGFLESGKTMFIQDTLEDKRFNAGERTLLLLCEEGTEEYDASKFSGKNVKIEIIDSPEELNEERLTKLAKEFKPQRVMVEYNGMWQLQRLYDAIPEDWLPYQDMLFINADTFLNYNANMRSLVVDKLSDSDVVVFNRVPQGFDTMQLHKIVRGISRRADILYEYIDGTLIPDETEDPLPFDINAPIVEIADRDFALFYRDIIEEQKKYKDKTVSFKGIAALDSTFPDRTCAVGRHVMTCCADDIAYCGFVARLPETLFAENNQWYDITAKVDIRFSRIYGKKGPVLYVISLEKTSPPEEKVATFY